MKINAVSKEFGAVIDGLRLQELSDTQFNQVYAAWLKYAVLLFPKQHLTNEEHVSFTKRFGVLERGLRRSGGAGAGPIGNVDREGNLLPEANVSRRFNIGNSVWHTDSSYKRVGAKASLLAAHMVPSSGGETEWADMRAAYEELTDEMKEWLEDKVAVHSYRFSHAWHGGLEILSEEDLEYLPPVQHKIIKQHPETKRNVLFVGRHASHIIGEKYAESRKLLRELTFEATQPPRVWTHKWDAGDLVIWDNRCVLHRARYTPPDEKRAMVRTTVAGEEPNNEWAYT